jgi:membrane peptidoglycan carboxypeptidase
VVDFDVADKCRFGDVPDLLDLKRFERPFLHTVFEPDGTVYEMETGPGSAAWTPIELISPFMTQAAIAHEDGRFLSHHGFAEPEIARALARNLQAKAFRFGASTITMQLVKNLFLHRDKLLSRKVQEAFIVWWLEQHWDKRRILEMYLNVIEYGPALYGIRAASLHYFGQIPLDLTPAQAAFFASILPSPKTFHEHYEKGALSASMKNRVAAFLQHLFSRQRIDEEALKFGLEELNAFKFYDPNQPPPAPPQIRGTAVPLPFIKPGLGFDPWSTAGGADETGSFGPQ